MTVIAFIDRQSKQQFQITISAMFLGIYFMVCCSVHLVVVNVYILIYNLTLHICLCHAMMITIQKKIVQTQS